VPRILIDVTRLLVRRTLGRLPTGVDRVGLEYIRHYASSACALLTRGPFSIVLGRAGSMRLFDALLGGALDKTAGPEKARWQRNREGLLIHTGHMGLESAAYARALRRHRAQGLIFVHDLIPISHPEYCRPGEADRHMRRMTNALSLASGIIVNSADTLEALERFAGERGLRRPPVVIAPLAPGLRAASIPEGRPVPGPYFVVLGTIEPRKNHGLLLQVWRRLFEKLGPETPQLFVVGHRGWECEQVVDLLERCKPLQGFVHERSRCGDAELSALLGHAQALLMPSFVEGYGMPVVEALACGVPVIASDLAVFREIAGDIPDYVDPLNGPEWMARIEAYFDPRDGRRAGQLRRIAHFRAPTWDAHFGVVDEFAARLCPGA
jgi:glycosyltransferase involved in cell wall biosynthesis